MDVLELSMMLSGYCQCLINIAERLMQQINRMTWEHTNRSTEYYLFYQERRLTTRGHANNQKTQPNPMRMAYIQVREIYIQSQSKTPKYVLICGGKMTMYPFDRSWTVRPTWRYLRLWKNMAKQGLHWSGGLRVTTSRSFAIWRKRSFFCLSSSSNALRKSKLPTLGAPDVIAVTGLGIASSAPAYRAIKVVRAPPKLWPAM